MAQSNYYNFSLVPLQTDMTVREFRQAIAGEVSGNFALLDNILAGLDVISCSVSLAADGESYVLVLTRKDGSKIETALPNFGEVKEEDLHDVTAEELDALWAQVFTKS